MEGQILSHYKVLEKLGGGGMGVVYKALDSRLDRHVALKFLPPELTRDDDARERFVLEAKAASALDHPNICTVHDVDETPDGQLFIAMGYYEGKTLKKRIEQGPLPIEEALDIAVQVTQGLVKAHGAGIIHRDIKPANLIVTEDGLVKILDFGIAKLTGQTALTQTGITLGTMAYMSPEQLAGADVDQRADLWALGIVLYEMLTGQRPFRGEPETALMSAILNNTPKPVRDLAPSTPARLGSIVTTALEKDRKARYTSAVELGQELAGCHTALTASPPTAELTSVLRAMGRPRVAVAALLAVILIGAGAFWAWNRGADARWAREEAIPEVIRLVQEDEYIAAMALAEQAERFIPDAPELTSLWSEMSVTRDFATDPPGADVYFKSPAAVDGDWVHVGPTPLANARVPSAVLRWKFEKEGFETAEFIWGGVPNSFALPENGTTPDGMVAIPASSLGVTLSGFDRVPTHPAGEYLIDKHEVTNAEYREFVDAGGYTKTRFWTHDFVKGGEVIPWEDAMEEFQDRTGRFAPATWEVGTYLRGKRITRFEA